MNETIRMCIKMAPWEDIVAESATGNLPVLLDALIEEVSGCQRLLDIFPRLIIDAAPEEQRFFAGLGEGRRRKLRRFIKKLVRKRRQLIGYLFSRMRVRSRLASKGRGRF
jgi:hypothetical protein